MKGKTAWILVIALILDVVYYVLTGSIVGLIGVAVVWGILLANYFSSVLHR